MRLFSFDASATRYPVPTIQDLLHLLQRLIPNALAESWDNVGLLAGSPHKETHSVLLGLDPTLALVQQAKAQNIDLIITHHPAIFRPLKNIHTNTPTGAFLAAALGADISVIACHTNLDAAAGGVSDLLARNLNLQDIRPLVPNQHEISPCCGLGRIGTYANPLSAKDFLQQVQKACAPPWILEAGPRPELIHRVAVCGGSCSEFAETALQQGAEVFLTSEVKHAVARWAEEAGLWLLDAGHFATEYPAMAAFAMTLHEKTAELGWSVNFHNAVQHTPLKLVQENLPCQGTNAS